MSTEDKAIRAETVKVSTVDWDTSPTNTAFHSRAPSFNDDVSHCSSDGTVTLSSSSPARPWNWSFRKKFFHTLTFSSGAFVTQFSGSILSPATEFFQVEYHVGHVVALLPTSLFVIGIGFGPMFMAPLSEVYGRKTGVFVPLFISALLLMWCATCENFIALTVIRFFAGVFGSAPLVTSGGALADMWTASSRAGALAIMGASVILGASTSPIIGALILYGDNSSYEGWRWCMWLSAFMALIDSLVGLFCLDETYVPCLEQTLAQAIRRTQDKWYVHSNHDKWHLNLQEFVKVHLMRPIQLFLTPIVTLLALYASFVYGVMYLIITSVDLNFSEVRGWQRTVKYLPLVAYGVGFVLGCAGNFVGSIRYRRVLEKNGGEKLPPEERLIPVMFMGWTFPVGLFLYGWTSYPFVHWIVPMIGLAFCGAGVAFAFQGCLVYLVDAFSRYSASATASSTLCRSIFGGVFPLFGKQMYDALGFQWGATLLALLGVIFTPVPWIYYFYGAKIRKYSPYSNIVE